MENSALFDNFKKDNPCLVECMGSVLESLRIISEAFRALGKLMVCGNGGSASDSLHIVGELQKSFKLSRNLSAEEINLFKDLEDAQYLSKYLAAGLPAISLVSEVALISAMSNDVGSDLCFAQQVWSLGRKEDVLLCISTSGNSRNVVLAAEAANAKGMKVISLIGNNREAKLIQYSDVTIMVPSRITYRVQEFHLPIYHLMCAALEEEFFAK